MFVGKILAFHGDVPNIPAFYPQISADGKTEVICVICG